VNGSHADLIRAVLRRNHELDGAGRLRRKPRPGFALTLAQIYQGHESGLTAHPDAVAGLSSRVRVEWLGMRHHIHWDHPDEVAARILGFA
jgi:hypothetical protein